MIEDNKLEVDNLCNVELSDKYKKVSTSGEKKIKSSEIEHPIVIVDKLNDNWYYVVTYY